MTAEELTELVVLLQETRGDTASIEAKRSEQNLPRRLWETLSSFANSPGGGLILLGVDEEAGFTATGVRDPAKIQADLASMCDQMEPPLRPLIQMHQLGGRFVVTAEIPEVSYQFKPCFYRGAGMIGGSFIRIADGDRHLTQYEIQTFLEGRGQPVYDLEAVHGRSVADLDRERLGEFLQRLRFKSDTPYVGWEDSRLLRAFRVLTEGDNGPVPTLAGYLCFGRYPQEDFPGLYLSVVRYPTTVAGEVGAQGERLPDNVKLEGNIPRMLQSSLAAITRNLRQRSVVVGLWRQDLLEYPVEILREALVNALGHRDYSPFARGTPVQVRVFPDRLEVENPGGLFGPVTVDRLGEPGIQASRNAYLMKLLEDAPSAEGKGVVAENRGTGIVAMLAALRRAAMAPPIFDDRRTTFRIAFSNASLLDTEALNWLTGLQHATLSDNQRLALAYARKNSRITNAEYCRLTLVDSRDATRDLAELVRQGLLVQEGARRWASYILAQQPSHLGTQAEPATVRRADRRAQIMALLISDGPLTAADIARKIGLTRAAVLRWLRILRDERRIEMTTRSPKSPMAKYAPCQPTEHDG